MFNDMMLDKVAAMRKSGYSEKEIADFFGVNVIDLRYHIHIRHRDNRIVLVSEAKKLKDEGKSVDEIANLMKKNESTVRYLLEE